MVLPSHALFNSRPHTVTFDCWNTLMYESDHGGGLDARARVLRRFANGLGVDVASDDAAAEALGVAWRRHQELWRAEESSGAAEMAGWILEQFGIDDPAQTERLADLLIAEIHDREIHALDGARDALATLDAAGVRIALICDTGFTPGVELRKVLGRLGLLEYLEVQVFSDEVGVPKPQPAMFAAALDGLGVPATGAVHVGDLRRTDVAGARAYGMGSVRITDRHDDPPAEGAEADAVVASHAELIELLGWG